MIDPLFIKYLENPQTGEMDFDGVYQRAISGWVDNEFQMPAKDLAEWLVEHLYDDYVFIHGTGDMQPIGIVGQAQ